MLEQEPTCNPVAENAVLIRFGDAISEDLLDRIVSLQNRIDRDCADWVVDLVPSYTTLLVQFDPLSIDQQDIQGELRRLLSEHSVDESQSQPRQKLVLPVWYDPQVAPDLESLAQFHDITVEEVIRRHTNQSYRVYALGFSPGFAFLGQVDPRIATSRHPSPRDLVAAGSVGIADRQTAVYPRPSPGGWQIIGRSPQVLFDADKPLQQAPLLQVGDQVSFRAIDRSDFIALGGQL